MGRHMVKVIFLLIPALASICLLSFCLISDWWIKIDQNQLINTEKMFEYNYQVYTGEREEVIADSIVSSKPAIISKSNKSGNRQTSISTSTTTTSTTTTTKSTTTTTTPLAYDTEDLDSDMDDTEGEDTFDNNGHTDSSHSPNYDYDTTNKRLKRDYSPKLRQQTRVTDYVYVTKLWPLTKFKSLYSECVEYKKFYLKISTAYLNQPNKEPVIGTINYGKNLNELMKQSKNGKQCDTRAGMIKCLLSQQCVYGKICDGIVDCDDQSDEQVCDASVKCQGQVGGIPFQCDNRCWQYWNKCDQTPNCLDLSDELSPECSMKTATSSYLTSSIASSNGTLIQQHHIPFTLGKFYFNKKYNCFVNYFDFKSAQLIRKENLKYLTQSLADHIQETNNINYHLQLIYALAFSSALVFSLLALFSLVFVTCFKKLCFQCPFWFYGFFAILSWLASSFGLMTFLYQTYSNKQKTLDPMTRLPIENELIRLNPELAALQDFGIAFWVAVAATSCSFLSSFISCIVCCRLPSARHEDKEYKIMQLPTYT